MSKYRKNFSLWSEADEKIGHGVLYAEGNVVVLFLKGIGHCYRLMANLTEAMHAHPDIKGLTFD